MQLRQMLMTVISVAVLVCLMGALMFATRAFKAKDDPQSKKKFAGLAWLLVAVYVILNALRQCMEKGLL